LPPVVRNLSALSDFYDLAGYANELRVCESIIVL
jgi:hypothetical protein